MDKIKINKQTKRSLKNKMEYFKENIFRDKKRNQKYKQDKGLFWNKRIKRMLCCRNQLLRKAFLSLLAILWYSAFKWVYLSFSPLPLALILPQLFVSPPQATILPFCIFFLGDGIDFAPVKYCKPLSILIQALCLSALIPWNYLLLPLYNLRGFDWGHTWMV